MKIPGRSSNNGPGVGQVDLGEIALPQSQTLICFFDETGQEVRSPLDSSTANPQILAQTNHLHRESRQSTGSKFLSLFLATY